MLRWMVMRRVRRRGRALVCLGRCCCPLAQRIATPLGSAGLQGHEIRTVVFVAFSFQMVFTGYRSIQNLQSSLNEENGLGVISLGVLYGAWIFSGFLTPTVLRLLTTKGALMVSWICHMLYTACTFYPAWALIVPASFLVGIFQAPLWTSQSLYIAACGYSIARRDSGSLARSLSSSRSRLSRFPYHVFSRLNGIFFAIYETSQITGNLISSLVLRYGMGNRTEGMHFVQCGKGDCPSAHNATDFEEPEHWVTNVLLTVYLSFNVIGLLMTYFFVMPLPKSDWGLESTTKKTVTSFFVTLRRTSIGWLVPMFIFQGLQQAMLYSEFTRSYISCPLGIYMVGFVMATHGATTPLSTALFSRAVKYTGRYVLFILAGLVNMGLMAVMFVWTPVDTDRPFIFLGPVAWGVAEGIWLTQSSSLIAVQYKTRKEPAFAIYHTCRSVGMAFTFAVSRWLCARVKVILGMSLALFGLVCYTVSELLIQRREKLRRHSAFPNGAVSHLALSTVSGLAGGLRSSETASSSSTKPTKNYNHLVHRLETVFEKEVEEEEEGEREERTGQKWEDEDVDDEVFYTPSSPAPVAGPAAAPFSSPETPSPLEGASHLPRVASSSTSILSTLALMARMSYSEEEEDEFLDSLSEKTRQRLSASISVEENCYF